jgi:hypothetical protein
MVYQAVVKYLLVGNPDHPTKLSSNTQLIAGEKQKPRVLNYLLEDVK